MEPIISLFSEKTWEVLEEGLESKLLQKQSLREEDLRHSVVEALESFGMFPKGAIRLNFPHPVFRGKKIDVLLPPFSEQDAIACELKYDRAIPSRKNQPTTMKAGAIVNDILRLAHLSTATTVERFFVYLTDGEMFAYLRNPGNSFSDLFRDDNVGRVCVNAQFLIGRASSLMKMIKVPVLECTAFNVLDRGIGNDHHLSVIFVRPD